MLTLFSRTSPTSLIGSGMTGARRRGRPVAINKEAYDYYKSKGQDRQYFPEKLIAHWWERRELTPTIQ